MKTNKARLGTIRPGETKEFNLSLPPGVKRGDEFWLMLCWVCGGCNKKQQRGFHVVVGSASNFNFECLTPSCRRGSWLQALFSKLFK
jgi:hypothetical protein